MRLSAELCCGASTAAWAGGRPNMVALKEAQVTKSSYLVNDCRKGCSVPALAGGGRPLQGARVLSGGSEEGGRLVSLQLWCSFLRQ